MPPLSKIVKWQLPMKRVLYALAPLVVLSITMFGWRVLALLLVCNAAAVATEYAFTRLYKQPATSAALVTGTLFTLSLPPCLPIWMAVVGVVFGVVFGKMVFGGFGMNPFNPALTGRAFLYVSFGAHMTGQWAKPYEGWLGGLVHWGRTAASAPDAITTATPSSLLKLADSTGSWAQNGMDLFLGHSITGTIGGTSAILTLLCGLWLVRTKAANYRIVISGFTGFLVMQTLFWVFGVGDALDPLTAVCAGSVVIGLFFYATDPVSASQTNQGRWIYGAFIGIMTTVISTLSAWPAGTMFAILLANMFAPIMDYAIKQMVAKKKARAA